MERVQEVIMKGAQALPADRLKVDPSHTHTHLLDMLCIYLVHGTVGDEKMKYELVKQKESGIYDA